MNAHLWSSLILWAFCAGWALGWWLNRKPPVVHAPVIKFVITQEVLAQIDIATVNAWLEQRGLTWMPRGAVFDSSRGVKK